MNLKSMIPKLLTLKMASRALGLDEANRPLVSISVLRAEIRAKRLACMRHTPGSSARILIDEQELARWVHEVAAMRQLAVSPQEAANSRKAAAQFTKTKRSASVM